jgi:hypothetical protein
LTSDAAEVTRVSTIAAPRSRMVSPSPMRVWRAGESASNSEGNRSVKKP